MPTDAENLATAYSRILTELAAGPMKPTYSIDGQGVSWETYRASLVAQLKTLREEASAIGTPIAETIYIDPVGGVRD